MTQATGQPICREIFLPPEKTQGRAGRQRLTESRLDITIFGLHLPPKTAGQGQRNDCAKIMIEWMTPRVERLGRRTLVIKGDFDSGFGLSRNGTGDPRRCEDEAFRLSRTGGRSGTCLAPLGQQYLDFVCTLKLQAGMRAMILTQSGQMSVRHHSHHAMSV